MSDKKIRFQSNLFGWINVLGGILCVGVGVFFIFLPKIIASANPTVCFWIGIALCVLSLIPIIYGFVMMFVGVKVKPKKPKYPQP